MFCCTGKLSVRLFGRLSTLPERLFGRPIITLIRLYCRICTPIETSV